MKLVLAVVFGQAISLAVCFIDVIAKALNLHGSHFSAFLDFGGYAMLALIFLPAHYVRWSASPYDALKLPATDEGAGGEALGTADKFAGLKVLAVALTDAAAAYTATVAYQHNVSVASVALLNSFAIPCAMLLSYFMLGARYTARHGLGVSLALTGLVVVVVADVQKASDGKADPDSVYGDALTLLSAALYALSNVLSEKLVKSGSMSFFLAWLGVGGAILMGLQTGVFEPGLVIGAPWSVDAAVPLLYVAFTLLFAFVYAMCAKYLAMYDAVALNLSFLSTNVYGVVLGVLLFDEVFQWLSMIGFCFIVGGLTVYHWPARAPVAVDEQTA